MITFQESISEYKKQLKKGYIQEAYTGLMKYIRDLKSHFNCLYPDRFPSGSIYYGYLDMTYFPLFPESLKHNKLKIAIVLIHNPLRFEVWLVGYNRNVQKKYWNLVNEYKWDKYRIPILTKGVDSIIEYTLVDNPDFGDLNDLTKKIEMGTLKFIKDVENFLSKYQNLPA